MAQAVRGAARERLHIMLRPRQDPKGRIGGDGFPALPSRQILKIIRPHQPDEIDMGKKPVQAPERHPGIARAELCLDRGGNDAAAIGDCLGGGQPFGERRHAPRWFQRIAGRYHQPDLIEREAAAGELRDVTMTFMGRIEGPAQNTDAHAPPVAMLRHGVPLTPHGKLNQGRTWPDPRT